MINKKEKKDVKTPKHKTPEAWENAYMQKMMEKYTDVQTQKQQITIQLLV